MLPNIPWRALLMQCSQDAEQRDLRLIIVDEVRIREPRNDRRTGFDHMRPAQNKRMRGSAAHVGARRHELRPGLLSAGIEELAGEIEIDGAGYGVDGGTHDGQQQKIVDDGNAIILVGKWRHGRESAVRKSEGVPEWLPAGECQARSRAGNPCGRSHLAIGEPEAERPPAGHALHSILRLKYAWMFSGHLSPLRSLPLRPSQPRFFAFCGSASDAPHNRRAPEKCKSSK